MKAIHLLIQAIRRLFQRSPSSKVSPDKIKATKKSDPSTATKDAIKKKEQETTFFTDRLDAEGTEAMRQFRYKHRHRLRNQGKNHEHDVDHGIDH